MLFLASASVAMAQTSGLLVEKKWVTHMHEIAGEKFPAPNVRTGDGTVFSSDGTFSSIDQGIRSKGTWKLSENEGQLIFQNENDKGETALRIVSIGKESLVVESGSGEKSLIIHLKAEIAGGK